MLDKFHPFDRKIGPYEKKLSKKLARCVKCARKAKKDSLEEVFYTGWAEVFREMVKVAKQKHI